MAIGDRAEGRSRPDLPVEEWPEPAGLFSCFASGTVAVHGPRREPGFGDLVDAI